MKKQLTNEQLYDKREKIAFWLQKLTPIIYWGFILLAVFFFIMAIKNSLGNVMDIVRMLDKNVYSGEQIAQNYADLVAKWGEWTIIDLGATDQVSIQFVDIRNALFSGLMTTFVALMITSILIAFVVGKIVFPQVAESLKEKNKNQVAKTTFEIQKEIKTINKK